MVRQRVHFYLKAKEAQRRRVEEREQRGEEPAEESEEDDNALWSRQDQLSEITENPLTGSIREPKKNKGNAEYKRRKRRAKKSRKKQRKAEAKAQAQAAGAILAEPTLASDTAVASQPLGLKMMQLTHQLQRHRRTPPDLARHREL